MANTPQLIPNDQGDWSEEDRLWMEHHASSLKGRMGRALPSVHAPAGSRARFDPERFMDCSFDFLRDLHVTAAKEEAESGHVGYALVHITMIRMLDRVIEYEAKRAAR